MMRIRRNPVFGAFLAAVLLPGLTAVARADSELSPYRMLRSLQFMQDSVVLGDHSAAEMQRFMLGAIDNRLRTAEPSIFSDARNADAALIYAMSGGNPATLSFLFSRDINGSFDTRLVNVLQKYFEGRGGMVSKSIAAMVPEYRDTMIGPYLALVAGNITAATDPQKALGFFDEARLIAPGTIVEEAALRRALATSVDKNLPDKALAYSSRYVRRFLHSPYSNQFADLFVQLAVTHDKTVTQEEIGRITGLMDIVRAQEIYLRISRQAILRGKIDLARFAASEADRLGGQLENGTYTGLSDLYGGVAGVSSTDVVGAVNKLSTASDETLSDRDRALKTAAQAIAEQILRPPSPDNPGPAGSAIRPAAAQGSPTAGAGSSPDRRDTPASTAGAPPEEGALRDFVEQNRARLDEIDALLDKEGNFR